MDTDVELERDAFAERMFGSLLGAVDMMTIYLGERLGLYAALRDHGAATAAELAERTGTHERYIREWLEQQAVADILRVEVPDEDAGKRRYSLAPGHADVLLDPDSLAFLAPIARLMVSAASVMPQLKGAFASGGGVDWSAYGADAYEGQASQNRPVFLRLLGQEWLPQVPEVHERLADASDPARVLDIGCGGGWACIGMARAYPSISVEGVDLDEPAIELARRSVADLGLDDRISFHAGDAATLDREPFDLITMLEMVHDMSFPVEVLATARGMLAEGGSVIVMDEKVAHAFEAPGDELERLFYGFSVLMCLPTALVEDGAAGTGTVMRPDTLKSYAEQAGFTRFEILPIEHDFFRFYRLQA